FSASREKNLQRLRRALSGLTIWPFDEKAAAEFGRIRAELRRHGRPMQVIDIMIAATALSLGNCTVVSTDSDLNAVRETHRPRSQAAGKRSPVLQDDDPRIPARHQTLRSQTDEAESIDAGVSPGRTPNDLSGRAGIRMVLTTIFTVVLLGRSSRRLRSSGLYGVVARCGIDGKFPHSELLACSLPAKA